MDAEQFELTLKDAETRLRRLRALYDQWFTGVERLEPRVQRDDLDRVMARLKAMPPRNTGLRFRLNQLSQQLTTYTTYWKRITRQIEEGTYQRDVLRARRRRDEPSVPVPEPTAGEAAEALGIDVEVELGSIPPPRPSAPPVGASIAPLTTFRPGEITPLAQPEGVAAPRAKSVHPPALDGVTRSRPKKSSRPPPVPHPEASAGDGVPDAQMRALYDRYVRARQDNAERTDNVSLESLTKSVSQLLPKLKAKHPGKRVGFAVVVRDGKVALKPVAK